MELVLNTIKAEILNLERIRDNHRDNNDQKNVDYLQWRIDEHLKAIEVLNRAMADISNEATATLPINSVKPRLIIQGIEFYKLDEDNETEIVVPSHGYDDDNHIWLTIEELKQIGKFYFNGA